MIVARRETLTGRVLLVLLMAITVLPFVSLFVTALHPAGTYPSGLSWPDNPHWGNFADAFRRRPHERTAAVQRPHRARRRPDLAVLFGVMAGFAFGHLRMPGHRWSS